MPAKITAADTSRDATGTAYELLEATATTYVDRVRFQALGTNNATAARIFVNDGGPAQVGENNYLLAEVTLPSTTASEVAAVASVDLTLEYYLPAGYRLLVTVGTAPTAGIDATAITGTNYAAFH